MSPPSEQLPRRDEPRWDSRGLLPVVVQDVRTRQVLMVAYMNEEALEATRRTGLVHLWSRSREELWQKGATSGNTLRLVEAHLDCDGDALLVLAEPAGPTCHTGSVSCFGGEERGEGFALLEALWETIGDRMAARPEGSYTVSLVAGGVDQVGRKVCEEATELLLAAKDHATGSADERRLAEEGADLLYHLLALLAERRVAPSVVLEVLAERAR